MSTWLREYPVKDEPSVREQLGLVLDEVEGQAAGDARIIGWLAAQYETLQWIIGDRDRAPISLSDGLADREAIMDESSAVTAIVFDPARLKGDPYLTRAQGVDRVLQWALGKAEAPMAWKRQRRAG